MRFVNSTRSVRAERRESNSPAANDRSAAFDDLEVATCDVVKVGVTQFLDVSDFDTSFNFALRLSRSICPDERSQIPSRCKSVRKVSRIFRIRPDIPRFASELRQRDGKPRLDSFHRRGLLLQPLLLDGLDVFADLSLRTTREFSYFPLLSTSHVQEGDSGKMLLAFELRLRLRCCHIHFLCGFTFLHSGDYVGVVCDETNPESIDVVVPNYLFGRTKRKARIGSWFNAAARTVGAGLLQFYVSAESFALLTHEVDVLLKSEE